MTREGGREVDVLVAAWNRADIDDGSADYRGLCEQIGASIGRVVACLRIVAHRQRATAARNHGLGNINGSWGWTGFCIGANTGWIATGHHTGTDTDGRGRGTDLAAGAISS